MGQAVVCQESDGDGLWDVSGLEFTRGDSTSDDYQDSFLHEEIAFSMSKIHFNVNDEGIILQSNKNAKIIIQYK